MDARLGLWIATLPTRPVLRLGPPDRKIRLVANMSRIVSDCAKAAFGTDPCRGLSINESARITGEAIRAADGLIEAT